MTFLYSNNFFLDLKVNQAIKKNDNLTSSEFKQNGKMCLTFLEIEIKSGGI